jgi:hypothetical protein
LLLEKVTSAEFGAVHDAAFIVPILQVNGKLAASAGARAESGNPNARARMSASRFNT